MNIKLIAAIITMTVSAVACAGETEDVISSMMKSKFPGIRVSSVNESPVPGFYEVYSNAGMAYVSGDGSKIFVGELIDVSGDKPRNLTSEHIAEITRMDFGDLTVSDAITIKRGNGKFKFAVFSDPDCPYCKAMEKELEKVTNYTEYVYMFPLESLHPKARAKAEAIWCSKDRADSWMAATTKNREFVAASCDNPIDRNAAFAENHGIQGTPTVILENGKRTDYKALVDAIKSQKQ